MRKQGEKGGNGSFLYAIRTVSHINRLIKSLNRLFPSPPNTTAPLSGMVCIPSLAFLFIDCRNEASCQQSTVDCVVCWQLPKAPSEAQTPPGRCRILLLFKSRCPRCNEILLIVSTVDARKFWLTRRLLQDVDSAARLDVMMSPKPAPRRHGISLSRGVQLGLGRRLMVWSSALPAVYQIHQLVSNEATATNCFWCYFAEICCVAQD